MSYQHNSSEPTAPVGCHPGFPRVLCDASECTVAVEDQKGTSQWLRNGTAPRGWRQVLVGETPPIVRFDYCPQHRRKADR